MLLNITPTMWVTVVRQRRARISHESPERGSHSTHSWIGLITHIVKLTLHCSHTHTIDSTQTSSISIARVHANQCCKYTVCSYSYRKYCVVKISFIITLQSTVYTTCNIYFIVNGLRTKIVLRTTDEKKSFYYEYSSVLKQTLSSSSLNYI